MNIDELATPAFLVDMDILESNLRNVSELCRKHEKKLFPMTKTHKSADIAALQLECGADGFLTGTLDEAEMLMKLGKPIMLAYPFVGEENVRRIVRMAKSRRLILSLDSFEAAAACDKAFSECGVRAKYLLITDVGFGRFGVAPDAAGEMVERISNACDTLEFAGIASHPGQVYGCTEHSQLGAVANASHKAFEDAVNSLKKYGFAPKIVAAGSTPTIQWDVLSPLITHIRPGNYVYNDVIQIALGAAKEENCAMTVLAAVIAMHDGKLMLDCGSKCLGLDKGAHTNDSIVGYGRIKGHDELTIYALSEEVAKVKINGTAELKVGDKVRVIPNHACAAANMTSWIIGVRGNEVERIIENNMRGNSKKPRILI